LSERLAGRERGDVDLGEPFETAGKIDATGDDARNVIGRAACAHDRLLVVFDKGAVDLELRDELLAYAGEQTVSRQAQLARARLLFGQNIHPVFRLRNTSSGSARQLPSL